jgi:hypothetical protein
MSRWISLTLITGFIRAQRLFRFEYSAQWAEPPTNSFTFGRELSDFDGSLD